MSDQDDRLQALFQDAAGTPPESGFSYGDVTRASQRITRRRRVALAGAAAVVVALGGTGVVVAAMRDQGTSTSAASAPAAAPENNSPLMGRSDAAGAASAPLGPSNAECVVKHDPQLRTLVEQVLPEIIGATDAAITLECEPGGGRQVNVEVADAGVSGLLNVTYEPQGRPPRSVAGAISAPTASGGTVTVSSEAVGPGAAPFAAKLPAVLAYLAPRL